MTYALREACSPQHALPAQTARRIAPEALIALGFRGLPVHAGGLGQEVSSLLSGSFAGGGAARLASLTVPGRAGREQGSIALQGGSTTRPWTRTWMGVINLEAGISRQALYDDIYMSLANSDGVR